MIGINVLKKRLHSNDMFVLWQWFRNKKGCFGMKQPGIIPDGESINTFRPYRRRPSEVLRELFPALSSHIQLLQL